MTAAPDSCRPASPDAVRAEPHRRQPVGRRQRRIENGGSIAFLVLLASTAVLVFNWQPGHHLVLRTVEALTLTTLAGCAAACILRPVVGWMTRVFAA